MARDTPKPSSTPASTTPTTPPDLAQVLANLLTARLAPQPEPRAADKSETVWLSNIVDSSKLRWVPMLSDDEFGVGLQWYTNYKFIEPPMKIRPSKAQFTAIKELFANRQFHVDFGLLNPRSIRTARRAVNVGKIGSTPAEYLTDWRPTALRTLKSGSKAGEFSNALALC